MKEIVRSPGQTQIAISLSAELLATIDKRCAELGLNRSQYIRLTLEMDLDNGQPNLTRLMDPTLTFPRVIKDVKPYLKQTVEVSRSLMYG